MVFEVLIFISFLCIFLIPFFHLFGSFQAAVCAAAHFFAITFSFHDASDGGLVLVESPTAQINRFPDFTDETTAVTAEAECFEKNKINIVRRMSKV